ncbi:hypothetical protein B0H14DRAFT_2587299 [Mycena olivaceomarginata]|nr:hypothetical protein B0H14DRAFT_2587299 [Mycena olivaceomarginata]
MWVVRAHVDVLTRVDPTIVLLSFPYAPPTTSAQLSPSPPPLDPIFVSSPSHESSCFEGLILEGFQPFFLKWLQAVLLQSAPRLLSGAISVLGYVPGIPRGKVGNAALNGVTSTTSLMSAARYTSASRCKQRGLGTMGLSATPTFIGPLLRRSAARKENMFFPQRFAAANFISVLSSAAVTAATGPSDSECLETQRAAKRARKIADTAATAATTAPS